VDDLINGLSALFDSSDDVTGPINIGNPREFTMVELANLVVKMTNSNSKIEFVALPQDDPRQRKPDISVAKSVLGWEPKVDLESGLLKTIEYLQTQI
jgi:UDP-glucuronate decarboxylase